MKKTIYVALFSYIVLTTNAFSTELPPVAQQVKKILEQNKLLDDPKVSQKRYSSGAGFHYRYAHCVCQGWSLVV